MGILNTTPDSFSDGGQFTVLESALQHARQMIADGADILDIGGESTRPGSRSVDPVEEMSRVLPVIESIRKETDVLISIDTTKARVAEAALNAGADIVNDISGGTRDEKMLDLWARKDCGIIIMHSQGMPETMQDDPTYRNVVSDVAHFLNQQFRACIQKRIAPKRILFDPGIGFGKKLEHNLALLRNLEKLRIDFRPLLLGVSRKSFIGTVLKDTDMSHRDMPTVALTASSYAPGCRVFRVHDVLPNVQALRMIEAIHNVDKS